MLDEPWKVMINASCWILFAGIILSILLLYIFNPPPVVPLDVTQHCIDLKGRENQTMKVIDFLDGVDFRVINIIGIPGIG